MDVILGTDGDDFLVRIQTPLPKDEVFFGFGGNDTISGIGGNDVLFGGNGNDTLRGGSGDDFLEGAEGIDRMTGGIGRDRFQFDSITDSGVGAGKRDVITDFERNLDSIDLRPTDAKSSTSGNQDFFFIGGQNFFAEGQVRFFFENGNTIVQLNRTGTTGAEMEIELTGIRNLSSADFDL